MDLKKIHKIYRLNNVLGISLQYLDLCVKKGYLPLHLAIKLDIETDRAIKASTVCNPKYKKLMERYK